jgi:AraC-like DNA-binding protein
MLDELEAMDAKRLSLPMARDKRLLKLMQPLLEAPTEERSFEQLAADSGASVRTLARLFKKETGLPFSEWRTQLRLLQAIEQLEQGQSVNEIALSLGYSTASAFIAMFRRKTGVSPGIYGKS